MKRIHFSIGVMSLIGQMALAQGDIPTFIENTDTLDALDLSTRDMRLHMAPVDWDQARGTPSPDANAEAAQDGAQDGALGAAGQSLPGRPSPMADQEAQQLYPQDWARLEQGARMEQLDAPGDVGTLGTKDVFTQYCENCGPLHKEWPQRTVGKLFSNRGTCTASVISPKNVIVTAAHCCYNRGSGSWAGGWRFAPAYKDGNAPYGLFTWQSARILPRWISHGDRKSDVCVIKLRDDASGKGVSHYTGWLGRMWNYGSKQLHHSVGYPGNIGNGNKQEICVSESFKPGNACGGASVLNTGCSMTYGASGGPWIVGYRGGANRVNSVVSGYDSTSCTGSFGQTFNGPRFTSDNIVKLCNQIGC